MLGNVSKDPKYRKRILDAVDDDKKHPIHHGVQMQAHHIISAAGVKQSGLGNKLERFGYDINTLRNLTLIPSTLQGACHLGVQPHRGNHTAPIQRGDSDDDHPENYHDMVEQRVSELERILKAQCPADDPDHRRKVSNEMDKISRQVLRLIQTAPMLAPLTKVARHFAGLEPKGCGGVDAVGDHKGQPCPVGHNHERTQGTRQSAEKITFKKPAAYQLQPGQ